MRIDWTVLEVDLAIANYMVMLDHEIRGIHINKTQHRESLLKLISNRNAGSVEFKHQNISAVLIKLGLPYIAGYKPRWNYQKSLEERIIAYLDANRLSLEPKFQAFADNTTVAHVQPEFTKLIDSPPERQLVSESKILYNKKPFKINYIEREQQNMILGEGGERLVLSFEKWMLEREGKTSLANSVEWISQENDGAGFDILSKNLNGTDKYIEVKTTKLSKDTPFFFSKGEDKFSKLHSSNYFMYRIFNYAKSPKLFILQGAFEDFCTIEAVQFKGSF